MKKLIIWSVLCCLLTTPLISAVVYSPSVTAAADRPVPNDVLLKKISSLKIKDLQRLTGKKLTLKEKIAFLILKKRLKHKTGDNQSKGQTALIFGIGAIALFIIGLFVPFVILGSLVSSILAIVVGTVARKKDRSDNNALVGKLLGWITLGLIALLFILAVIIITSSSFWI